MKRKQLAVAQADLVETEDDLAELMGSVDPFEIELREAEAASAQADLEAAVQRLAVYDMGRLGEAAGSGSTSTRLCFSARGSQQVEEGASDREAGW